MLVDIVEARVIGPTSLRIRFADGLEGDVDIAREIPFRGVFARLADPAWFARVRVDADAGTVVWPNGADLAPDALYERIAAAGAGGGS
jgi:hypothetical protein